MLFCYDVLRNGASLLWTKTSETANLQMNLSSIIVLVGTFSQSSRKAKTLQLVHRAPYWERKTGKTSSYHPTWSPAPKQRGRLEKHATVPIPCCGAKPQRFYLEGKASLPKILFEMEYREVQILRHPPKQCKIQ